MEELANESYYEIKRTLIVLVLIGIFSLSFLMIAGSGTEINLGMTEEVDLSPEIKEYLLPPGAKDQTPITLGEISDEDFNTAEITISIGYNLMGCNLTSCSTETVLAKGHNLTTGLEITVGVETTRKDTESITDLSVKSLTGLPSVTSVKTCLLWNTSVQDHLVKQEVAAKEVGSRGFVNTTLTTISTHVRELRFTKDDLLIRQNERHWFLHIKDHNPKPPHIPGEEYSRPCGWLESFNITIGNVRYSSLLHPFFAAGWEVTADIAARKCEIFHKVETKQESSLLDWYDQLDEHWIPTGVPYGVAGVIGVAYFDHLDDLPSVYTDAEAVLNFLKGTGIWEIYYMVTTDQSDDIDDSDIIGLLDYGVDDRIGDGPLCDHCFWWITTHGWADWGWAGMLASSKTEEWPWGGWRNNYVTESSIGLQMHKITSNDVYLFYWMGNCMGTEFESLWEDEPNHHNHALIWCYQTGKPGMNNHNREFDCLKKHSKYANRSCQWLFGDEDYHTYWYSEYATIDVRKIEFAFEYAYPTINMDQRNKMGSHKFYLVPNTDGWEASCRTRGEPSSESTGQWGYANQYYTDHYWMFEAWEVNTFDRYVGFYKHYHVPSGSQKIHIEFEGRATSNHYYGYTTRLYVLIYSENWQTLEATVWKAYAGTIADTGWNFKDHTFILGYSGQAKTYNVFICYADAWSYPWLEHIYVKDISISLYPS